MSSLRINEINHFLHAYEQTNTHWLTTCGTSSYRVERKGMLSIPPISHRAFTSRFADSPYTIYMCQNGHHDWGTVCILLHECRPGWGTGQNRLLRGTGSDAFSYQPGNQGFLQEASQGMVRFYEGQLSPVCRSVGHLQSCLKCLLCFCVRLGWVYWVCTSSNLMQLYHILLPYCILLLLLFKCIMYKRYTRANCPM